MMVFFTLLFNLVEAHGPERGRGRITEMGIERAGKPGNLYRDIYSILITLYFNLHHTKNN